MLADPDHGDEVDGPGHGVDLAHALDLDERGGHLGDLVDVGVDEADAERGDVSWVAPVARALLGARVGDEVYWSSPDGRRFGARVLALLFQPEASGDFTL